MDEDTKILWEAVKVMRDSQKQYFSKRAPEELQIAKLREKKVDMLIKEFNREENLF